MRIAIMGAGGLGAYYGAMLQRGGEDVAFIARGAHLHALRTDGLRVESPHVGDFHLPRVSATDDPATLGPMDAVLIGVKSYDLAAASEAIRPLLGRDTFVVPLLNGVDMAERIGAAIGMERVLGGTVFLSCNVIAPGHLRHVFNGPFVFGELAGGRSARGDALEACLLRAGVAARESESIRVELWSKYIMVAALAGASATARVATRALMADADARSLYVGALREADALARAAGVALAADIVETHIAFAENVNPQHTVSMLLDLRAGRRLELETFQGTIVRLGEELGVPTPVNRMIYAALKPHANGARTD